MASIKFRKGDHVVVDENGTQVVYEILSLPVSNPRIKSEDVCYDARQVLGGKTRTIFEDEILRPATPVDSSAQLFKPEE